jgi:branched-chain amino acid transport system substrate-binding protein
MRGTAIVWAAVLACLGLIGGPGAAAQEPHRIGVSLGLSGVQGAAGQRQIKAVELAAEMINAKGGVHGRPIKLIIEDDQTKPELSVAKVTKLIAQDGVLALVGGNSGDTAMAIGAIAEKREVPFLSPTGYNHTDAQKNYKYTFLMIPDYDDGVESLAKYMVDKLGCKKLGLLRLTRLWGVQASNAYHAMAKKYGLTIAREETLTDTDKDMTPQLTNIKAAEPCAIAIWAAVPAAAISIKNARQLGIAVPLLGNPIFAAATTPEIAGEAAEGVIATATLVPADPLPRQKEYIERYRAKYSLSADMWDAAIFDAVNLVARAIGSLPPDKVTPKNVREQLATIKRYEGAGAVVDFTKHQWPLSESWVMITVKGGQAVRLAGN